MNDKTIALSRMGNPGSPIQTRTKLYTPAMRTPRIKRKRPGEYTPAQAWFDLIQAPAGRLSPTRHDTHE
jgi:hypothetical protein